MNESKKSETPAEQSQKSQPRAGTGRASGRKTPRAEARESSAALTKRPPCQRCGEVHTKCSGHTKHGPNTGKPCGANPPAGQLTCQKHGGNNPSHRAKGRERLLEMVDPAMVQLRRIIDKKDTTDADKLRAIQLVLDKTGFKPGVDVTIGISKFDQMISEVASDAVRLDRTLPSAGGGDELMPLGFEDAEQHVFSAQEDADRERHDEEAREYEQGRIRPDANTVRGEVVDPVQSRYDGEPPPGPTDPPRYARRAEGNPR